MLTESHFVNFPHLFPFRGTDSCPVQCVCLWVTHLGKPQLTRDYISLGIGIWSKHILWISIGKVFVIFNTIPKKIDHIRGYLITLFAVPSEWIDPIDEVVFHLSLRQTAALSLSLSDLKISSFELQDIFKSSFTPSGGQIAVRLCVVLLELHTREKPIWQVSGLSLELVSIKNICSKKCKFFWVWYHFCKGR